MTEETPHLRFYVDPSWKREGQHSPLLYPFWGNSLTEQTPFYKALFDRYGFDTRYYSITDNPGQADMVLMPYSHSITLRHFPELVAQCAQKSAELGLPLLIDGIGDVERVIDIPNVFVLRYGGYRFENKGNEIIIPPYADDLLEVYCQGKLDLRAKSATPVVGFAGWGKLSFVQAARSIAKEMPDRIHGLFDSRYAAKKKGVFFRAQAIRLLESTPAITANIYKRTSYSGHANTVVGGAEAVRREFVDNLLSSDYGLDVRGDANASTRLGEILALGRIPVIIDTERNYPFSDELDYSTFSIMIDFRAMHTLPARLLAFHTAVTNEEFQAMQRRARAAYEQYFRVDVLMPHIVHELQKRGVIPTHDTHNE